MLESITVCSVISSGNGALKKCSNNTIGSTKIPFGALNFGVLNFGEMEKILWKFWGNGEIL